MSGMAVPGPWNVIAEVYAQVPESLRREHRPSPWADAVLGTASVGSFLEGPCFATDGTMYMSDLAHGRILQVSTGGEMSVLCEYDGEPNGLAIHRDGLIYIADYGRGILTLDPKTGAISKVVDRYRFENLRGVSDLVFGPDGALYFSDQGQSDLAHPFGRVFRFRAAEGLHLLMDGIASPNGLALSPAADMLYVAVTRANAVYRIPLRPDGKVGKIGVHLHLSGGSGGPDGMAIDAAGGLAVAHYGLGRVCVFDELGLPAGVVHVPAGLGTTNVVYGGPNRDTVFVTEAETGTIASASIPRRGATLYSHTG
ncbi:gluconolactonase [Rhodococcus sp. 27YEA15]|uniref:SMP-30/gluconolactonase/LRE family protein n=1 Tax=Rhodococcus sp. 27YEA15 TaxID=3156259 RepID=UPI003C7B151A